MPSPSRFDDSTALEPQSAAEPATGKKSPPFSRPNADVSLSLKQPPWHVFALGSATCKLYLAYWYYKSWKDLASHVDSTNAALDLPEKESVFYRFSPGHLASFRQCSPLLRTVCSFIPYVNNYLFLTLALGIARLHPDKQALVARQPLVCAALLVFASITLSLLSFLPGAWYLLFLLAVLPAAVAQHWLNNYWDTVEPEGLLYRTAFTLKELVVIVVGALFLGFIVAGFIMGAPVRP